VDLGAEPHAGAAPTQQRLCPRCRGTCEGAAQFCRFCGASLAAAQILAHPSPNPRSVAPDPRALHAPSAVPPSGPSADPAFAAAVAPPAARTPSSPGPPANAGGNQANAANAAVPQDPTARVAPAPRARARLVLIARDGGEGPSYPVGETTDIGRLEGNIVIGDDRYIAPRHARIALRSGAFFLRDLESVNGVYVRIPFERADKAGHTPSATSASGSSGPARPAWDARLPDQTSDANQATSEQDLADQELFLVGQQVLRFDVVKHAEEGFGVASENGTLLFGTPAAPRYARLSQRTVEGVVRDVFHIRKSETVIGRESGDIVFSDDPFLSRRHAVVHVYLGPTGDAPRRYTLSDLGSSNGTFLQVRDEVRLRHGDQFRIGQQLFRFDLDAGVRAGG
jgi:pSer/pThr/pTyr-binding forkhead associated (FHA) protein